MSTPARNEKKFGQWDELPDGGRRYRLDVPDRLGWLARHCGFTAEELDHAARGGHHLNCDTRLRQAPTRQVKYRLGRDTEGEIE